MLIRSILILVLLIAAIWFGRLIVESARAETDHRRTVRQAKRQALYADLFGRLPKKKLGTKRELR